MTTAFWIFKLVLMVYPFCLAQAVTYNGANTRNNFGVHPFDETIISPDSYLLLNGGGDQSLYGSLTNYGELFVTDDNNGALAPIFDVLKADHVRNYGDIVLDQCDALFSSVYHWTPDEFVNTGNIWFKGKGNVGGSSFDINPFDDVVNNGTINYVQCYSNDPVGGLFGAFFIHTQDPLKSIVQNNGGICLHNVKFQALQDIRGDGCVTIGEGAGYFLEVGALTSAKDGSVMNGGTIYMSASNSHLRIDESYFKAGTLGAYVAGFGNGNIIEVNGIITTVDYNDGNLRICIVFGCLDINIGPGYDPSLFEHSMIGQLIGDSAGHYTVKYNGAPPSGRPSSCPVCPSAPSGPSLSQSSSDRDDSDSKSVSGSTGITASTFTTVTLSGPSADTTTVV
ncbi:hypothetical protein SPOG_03650 [Schizosaccharomyces cryophilus OY26]|uniref:Hyphally-regulated cell wall protein N-terminal domain-containing protein n=1 Tax=Schizosaccharomyces cryophilus (strain OY26 / ATCC MYA-4695 / CBS 11777 / NBRC 106824 / NRRL Y48691) TaxID=653667 RepID=S9VZM6_SCHCR|nr:uncharacterized protein SPOG_03650 [Schizosaccharomyces cryophilus OY26]EPY53108.1 hypothetical protein SPOG_03650 [Schizosaccharomyces cryophilus OY26]